jgi:hypothetical protein
MVRMFREDRDSRNLRTRNWHRGNPARSYVLAAKGRARRGSLPFDLSEEDINFPEYCPVLGIPIYFSEGRIRNNHTPSLDRVIPEKGYVKGNVRIISWRANRLKNDATIEELKLLVAYMENSS